MAIISIPFNNAYASSGNGFFGFLEEIGKHVENAVFHLRYADELPRVNEMVDEFMIFYDHYTDKRKIHKDTDNFKDRLHQLRIVKENCQEINVRDLIKANRPLDELREFCEFPEKFSIEKAKEILRENR